MAKYSIVLEDKSDGSVSVKLNEDVAPIPDELSEAALLAKVLCTAVASGEIPDVTAKVK